MSAPGLGFLSAYISMPCDQVFGWCKESYQKEIGLKRRRGRTFGYINDGGPYYFFQSWRPRRWHSFCTTIDSTRRVYRTTINKKLVYESHKYSGVHLNSPELTNNTKIVMMNYIEDFRYPMFGAVTDVQIWDKILDDQQIRRWSECRENDGGNVINWSNVTLQLFGYKELYQNREEICTGPSDKYVPFETMKNLEDTLIFCQNIGGKMAVVTDNQTLSRMAEAGKRVDFYKCRPPYVTGLGWFFGGHQDMEEENTWVDTNTGTEIDWDIPWDLGFPTYYDNYDCSFFHVETRLFEDHLCKFEYCPMCRFDDLPVSFMLRGVCLFSSVDSYFVSSQDFQYLLGFIQSKIVYSSEKSRWEVRSSVDDDTVLAFLNETSEFPLGVHHWFFLDTVCTDPGKSWRSLNLHLHKEQPGNFCCDDGTCIESEKVCDGEDHCRDKTDELDCDIVVVGEKYDKGKDFRVGGKGSDNHKLRKTSDRKKFQE